MLWQQRWQLRLKLLLKERLGGIQHQRQPTPHVGRPVQESELQPKPHLSLRAVIARRTKEQTRSTRLEISAHARLSSARLGNDGFRDFECGTRRFVRKWTLS